MIELLILLPRALFSIIKSRVVLTPLQLENLKNEKTFASSKEIKPDLCFVLTQIMNTVGFSFERLIYKYLKLYDLDNYTGNRGLSEEQQEIQRNDFAKYFLNVYLSIDTSYLRIALLSIGYVVDFSCLFLRY